MISIVIPLYNKAHTIKKTLDSVFEQTYKDFEVIVVDDGSTDKSSDVINENFSDIRIQLIVQENQGVSAARNRGVENASSEYIAFLDGDDEWLPEYLDTMVNAIKKFPSVGLFCCAGKTYHAGGSIGIRLAKKYENKILEINFFENPHVFLHASATIVKKEIFNRTNGFPIGMIKNEDFAFFYSLAFITPVVYCGMPLSIYHGGVEGQATQNISKTLNLHIIERFNLVYQNWVKFGNGNRDYIIFTRYELRHILLVFLRKLDYETINQMYNSLQPGLLNFFSNWEWKIYRNTKLQKFGIMYILFTKMLWRFKGYPRVGR